MLHEGVRPLLLCTQQCPDWVNAVEKVEDDM
jgi:hypothetical protein